VDNSINGAIRKIRQVLKDDSEQPQFIQTITGRGYCFVAPVLPADSLPSQPRPRAWAWRALAAAVPLLVAGAIVWAHSDAPRAPRDGSCSRSFRSRTSPVTRDRST
jgi:hypothetical protein